MSDFDDAANGSATPGDPSTATGPASVRLGNGDREAALAALKAHLSAGRLDSREYEDRALRVSRARTWAELDPLFTDLPEPRPAPEANLSAGSTPGRPTAESAESVFAPRSAGLIAEPMATMLMAAAPILALILFFITDSWLWFLAIPLVAILAYGPGGRAGYGRERYGRYRGRDRRHDHHRARRWDR